MGQNEQTQNLENEIKRDTVLLFDMDGTLLDTNLANFLSYKQAIHAVTKSDDNLDYNPEERLNRSNLKKAAPNLSEGEYKRIIQEKEEYYKAFLPKVKLNKMIADVLFKYSKTNRTVLVTNCRKDRALTTLDHFGLTDKFSDILCGQFAGKEEGNINKFKNAISLLNISPKLIVAFENEEAEIINARKAGIQVINSIRL